MKLNRSLPTLFLVAILVGCGEENEPVSPTPSDTKPPEVTSEQEKKPNPSSPFKNFLWSAQWSRAIQRDDFQTVEMWEFGDPLVFWTQSHRKINTPIGTTTYVGVYSISGPISGAFIITCLFDEKRTAVGWPNVRRERFVVNEKATLTARRVGEKLSLNGTLYEP